MDEGAGVILSQLDVKGIFDDIVQIVFSIGVAWYLLTKTTDAINRNTAETIACKQAVERLVHVIEREHQETRRELGDIMKSQHIERSSR